MMLRAVLAVLMWLCAAAAWSHEVRPAIGDLWIEGGTVRLEIVLNAEAFLTGIDLDTVTDTNESEASGSYDALRALPPEALARRWSEGFGRMVPVLLLADGQAVAFADAGIEVPDDPDLELPRDSRARYLAPLPQGATEVALAWPAGHGTLILRQMGVDDGYTGYLAGGETTDPIPVGGGVVKSGVGVFVEYLPVGFDHIVPKGLDHILFVLGLFLLSTALRPLLWQISAFTLAHTVTLGLGAAGWVTVPASIVEPLIAASIAYVAFENLFTARLHPWRPVIVFCFGLLHGLGFASVLGEFGLPEGQFLPALLGFNVGVEAGQLVIVGTAWLLAAAIVSRPDSRSRPILAVVYLGLAVGCLGLAVPAVLVGGPEGADLVTLAGAAAILLGLCAVAALAGGSSAWRDSVARPASVLVGLAGAYWCIERIFL
jgi:hypothetical protein